MQITIDTERDDLLQVSRVIDVLLGTGQGPTINIKGPDPVYTGGGIKEALAKAQPFKSEAHFHTSDPVQQLVEDAETETLTVEGIKPEEALDPAAVFGNVKGASLFDQEPGKPSAPTAAETAGTDTPKPPTADATPATEPANGELDAAGTPWDERIHASTKTRVKDGTWKKRKGVDPELYNEVMEEISGDPKPADCAPIAETPAPASAQPGAVPPPPPPVAPPAPPVGELNFASFVKLVTNTDNNISAADISAACQAEGLASFPLLQQQPDKIPAVAKRLGLA